MKKIRDFVFAAGASAVLALGVVLAQDQAPAMGAGAPQPQPAPQPGAAMPPQPAAPQPQAQAVPGEPPTAHAAPVAPAAGVPAPVVVPAQKAALGRTVSPVRRSSRVPGIAPSAVGRSALASVALPPEGTEVTGDTKEPKSKTTTPSLKFDNAPADMLVAAYCEQTGKTPLMAPDVPKANITLKSQTDAKLTKEEYIEAIETVLSMNGIVLEPFGEKFIKVLARKTVRTDGIKIIMDAPAGGHPEKTKVVSQMIQLKSITVAEAQKALEGFKKADGQFQTFERTNSILVTDAQENVNRMLEIVKFIDQPLVAMEEVNVRAIHFAKAEDIKKRLEELVAESQKQTAAKDEVKANTSGSPGITRTTGITSSFSSRPLPPGLTRLGAQAQAAATPNETLETLVSDADRGMIRGKVQIIADERTNQLIIITRADNMAFFERIITVLDVETAPDVKVEVQRMEYADAEEVSTMLNDLIGNVTSKKDDKSAPKGTTKSTGTSGSTSGSTPGATSEPTARSTSLAEAVAARANRNNESSAADSTKSKLGQLSKENIKILADKRTNAIIMMGSIGDLAAVKEIIRGMDIQLSQVLIETVVLQVELGKDLQTGLDWVAGTAGNSYTLNHTDKLAGGGGSGSTLLQSLTGIEASTAAVSVVSSGVNYFLKSDKLNISALITAAQSDDRTKVLSSPVLLTVDNKEASIEATSMRYLYKGVRTSGTSSYGYTEVPDYEQRDIGLTVKVTPRISPNGMVVLTIDEKFETIGANQTVGTESYPTVNTRKVAADVSVNNMQTVILGGLVQNEIKTGSSGIPLLKDIPWVGKYLFGKTSLEETRSELLIFLTPYVLTNAVEAQAEAQRRKDTMHDDKPWSDGGWSKSQLADPVSAKEKLDRARKVWATEDEERDAEKTTEKLFRARRELMLKQTRQDAEEDARREKIDEVPSAGPSVGAMKTTESVQVIRPSAAPKPAPAENTPPPVAPEPEPSKKSWWWLF